MTGTPRPLSPAARGSFWILEGGSALILGFYGALRLQPWLALRTGTMGAWLLALLGGVLLAVLFALLIRGALAWLSLRARTVSGLILFATLLMAVVVPAVQTLTDMSRTAPASADTP
jgi:hypothetical protein